MVSTNEISFWLTYLITDQVDGYWIPYGSHLFQPIGCLVLRDRLVGNLFSWESSISRWDRTEMKYISPWFLYDLFIYPKEWMAEYLSRIFKMDIEWHRQNIPPICLDELWQIVGRWIKKRGQLSPKLPRLLKITSSLLSAWTISIPISLYENRVNHRDTV